MADSRCRPTAGASRSPTAPEGRSGLWVHSFETGQSRHLERAGQFTTSMFWSPDARFIGFAARGAIHRIAVDGTPPQRITPVEGYGGARWTPDGTILYGRTRGGLLKVPASGGTPVAVTELDAARDETGHTNPVMLPDGRRFLYFRASRNPEQNAVFVGSLDAAPAAQPTRPVLPLRTPPLLSRSPDGAVHLLFVRDGTLMAQELDIASMTLSGSASAIAERVAVGPGFAPQVSVAGGTLAFRTPDTPPGGVPTWFERDGRRAGPVFTTPMPPVLYPQISPDGTRLAAIVGQQSLGLSARRASAGSSDLGRQPVPTVEPGRTVHRLRAIRRRRRSPCHCRGRQQFRPARGRSAGPLPRARLHRWRARSARRLRTARVCRVVAARAGGVVRHRGACAPRRHRAAQLGPPVRRSRRMAAGWRTSPTPRAAPNCGCDATRPSTPPYAFHRMAQPNRSGRKTVGSFSISKATS